MQAGAPQGGGVEQPRRLPEVQRPPPAGVLQRQAALEEDEEVQRKAEPPVLQRQELDEEEKPVQRMEEEEEQPLQGHFTASQTPVQRQGDGSGGVNATGIPGRLKAGLEGLSGKDLSGVRVHKNSSKPARINALAYTQGRDIHVAPGQEKHLAHEGWHAVQQMQGRVKPTMQAKGVSINDEEELEREADVMGAKALRMMQSGRAMTGPAHQGAMPVQRFESNEHKTMRDKGSAGTKIQLPGGLEVTFGDITALAGDFFGSVAQIQELAAKAGDGKAIPRK